jgi:hypothetical protein
MWRRIMQINGWSMKRERFLGSGCRCVKRVWIRASKESFRLSAKVDTVSWRCYHDLGDGKRHLSTGAGKGAS